jgi:Arc/MetJ-type ribon-helix-helix transcriptional regulator
MTITLPDEMREALEREAAASGFASVNEYVADVLTADEEPLPPDFRTREELKARLDEGMASGPPVPCDAAFWAELDAVVRGESV